VDKQTRLARTILNGFRSYLADFENITLAARTRFEQAAWSSMHDASTRRIDLYREKVLDTLSFVRHIAAEDIDDRFLWTQTRDVYAELVRGMLNFEIAETFYNSIYNAIHQHRSINDDYAFVFSPQGDMPPVDAMRVVKQFRVTASLEAAFTDLLNDFSLALPYENLERDVAAIVSVIENKLGPHIALDSSDLRLQVLASHFYRNKAAYITGRLFADGRQVPFVLPVLHNEIDDEPAIFVDGFLYGSDQISLLFSFTRTYFMVDASVPSEYVLFLQQLMPKKAVSEIYSVIGHHRHGKTYFFRSAMRHMKATNDEFIIAPGIKGMVMTVFTLPSYEFVFKIIKDRFTPPKEVTHELVKEKYNLVKRWDRAGRMADTQEFTNLVFDEARFSKELIEELESTCPSQLERENGRLIIRHCYVERRMTPLNLYLQDASDEDLVEAMRDYGNSIKELAAANIFPGDMLLKNFGVTRHGRVVFYDYDEIQPLLECHFRKIPPPRDEYEEMSGKPWYSVGPNDIFPEEFRLFFSGNARARKAFDQLHADLYSQEFWTGLQAKLRQGHVQDFFPYPQRLRFERNALGMG